MVEGINANMKKVISVGVFAGFKVGLDGLKVSHLKYKSGTIVVEVPPVNNLLNLKATVRSFELALDLRLTSQRAVFWGSM